MSCPLFYARHAPQTAAEDIAKPGRLQSPRPAFLRARSRSMVLQARSRRPVWSAAATAWASPSFARKPPVCCVWRLRNQLERPLRSLCRARNAAVALAGAGHEQNNDSCGSQALRFESCDPPTLGKMPLRLGIESIRSLNFLFVCVRIRSLPRVAGSWARRSRSVHRAGKLAFRKQKPSRGSQKQKGSAHR